MSKIKNLPHRRWDTMRDVWIPHIPRIDIEFEYPSPTSWQYNPLVQMSASVRDGDEFENIAGLRECVFREAVIFSRKYIYCRTAALHSATQGFPTLACILNYDAALYAARSFLCLVGVINFGRHSKFYMDIFGERQEKIGSKKIIVYDMNIVHKLDNFLTHEMTWKLCVRMRDTFRIGGISAQIIQRFKELDLSRISNLRNNLLYDAAAWINADDYDHCDLYSRFGSLEVRKALILEADSEHQGNAYFELCSCFGHVLNELFGSLAEYAPALKAETEALVGWSSKMAP